MESRIESVLKDRREFIEVINESDMTQDESDTLLSTLDNVIQSYELLLLKYDRELNVLTNNQSQ
jgi:hypothetical protein